MPQAPAPQNNAHLYSDQNYAKPKSGVSKFYCAVHFAQRAAAEPDQFRR